MQSPSLPPVASQASGGQREPNPRHDSDSQPDPFTGRFGGLLSNLGEKREVEGRHAHHMENGKVIRSEGATHAPPLELSAAYDREIHPPRKKFLQRLQQAQSEQEIPRRASGLKAGICLGSAWRRNYIVLKISFKDNEAAHRKWLDITDEERSAVLQFYNSILAAMASEAECGERAPPGPTSEPYANGQHVRVLDQLLDQVDQNQAGPSRNWQPTGQPPMVIYHPQATRPATLEDPEYIVQPVIPAPAPTPAPAPAPMAGVSGSMHAPRAQQHFPHPQNPSAGALGPNGWRQHFPHPQNPSAGASGFMPAPVAQQHFPNPSVGASGFMPAPATGSQGFVSTTPPGLNQRWFGEVKCTPRYLFPTKWTSEGRARDVEMTVSPAETQEETESHVRPRLPPIDGQLQGDVSGHLNPAATIAFVKCLNGLTVVIEDQTQEIRTLRETFEDRLNGQAEVTSRPSSSHSAGTRHKKKSASRPHEDLTLRMRKRQKRIEQKVTRLRGEKSRRSRNSNVLDRMEVDDELDEEELSEDLTRLRARLRHAFEEVMQITDWADVYHMYPPLTSDELALYKARDPAIVPTAKNLRIDFHLGWSKPFNKEARAAFIDRYLERVQNGSYAKNPTPPELLTRECIGVILDGQMTNYRLKWRRSKTPLAPNQLAKLARAACQRSRKRTLHESREALLLRRGYTRHVRFFKMLEPVHMSGDETDGETKTHPPKWRIIVARWQSTEFRNFLWEIDRMYREDWGHPPHRRATGGNPPRDRVFRSASGENETTGLSRDEDGVAPPGLWRNCYADAWLKQQAPHVISELDIVDEDYDFSF
ncbi:hypothetical protein GSI_10040 [Ganoderma sinense ZZ0214-1]|uniref:Uncharacterized protein n=1 Tax=Ganoderma sinense ZZ0214-1 TaxID=1077348 RepID=A0A2G8RZF5_9APHY|nr:hypothetical protein GSI_10040 [Ganoderma sinense ZZ0214-1]